MGAQEFQPGNKVQRTDHSTFSNGDYVVTVKSIDELGRVWFEETDTYLNKESIELVTWVRTDPVPTEHEQLVFIQDKDGWKLYVEGKLMHNLTAVSINASKDYGTDFVINGMLGDHDGD